MSMPDQLLKHIPCPSGSLCSNAKCLFGHAETKPKTALAPVPFSTPSSAAASTDTRSKSDSVGYQDSTPPLSSSHTNVDPSRESLTLPKTRAVSTTVTPSRLSPGAAPFQPRGTRPESPSVLKRKRTESSESVKKTDSAPAAGGVAAKSPTPNLSAAAASISAAPFRTAPSMAYKPKAASHPQQKRKPESLNPRYVAMAPAKHEIRVRLVKLLHQEFTRLNQLLHASKERPEDRKQFLLSPQGLIWLALDTEEQYATSKSATVYSDTIKHRIMEFKRMTVSQWVRERKDAKERAKQARQSSSSSSAAAAAAAAAAATSKATAASSSTGTKTFTASGKAAPRDKVSADHAESPPKPIVTGLPPSQDLVLLQRHFLTPVDNLSNHGFVPSIPTDADIQKARDAEEISKGWEQCERCLSRFQVFPGRRESDGALTSGGQCVHHPGRFKRAEQTFDCCGESTTAGSSKGCETSPSHVFKVTDPKRLASLWNFVETPPNACPENVHAAVCFDCEMAYTVYGLEVVRVTATSWPKGHVILDVLVRPLGTIIDFNSKFSGVFASDFAAATPYPPPPGSQTAPQAPSDRPVLPLVASPQDARALLHQLISPETILIGHALENDLRALRMVHNRVSDTALLFPHPKGLPIRYSLRVLAKEHMDRIVQAGGNTTGHDSAEDARVAGELVLTKIKKKWEDMRRDGWKLVDGNMVRSAP